MEKEESEGREEETEVDSGEKKIRRREKKEAEEVEGGRKSGRRREREWREGVGKGRRAGEAAEHQNTIKTKTHQLGNMQRKTRVSFPATLREASVTLALIPSSAAPRLLGPAAGGEAGRQVGRYGGI